MSPRLLAVLSLAGLVACADYELGAEQADASSVEEFSADVDLRIDVYPPSVGADGTDLGLLPQSFRGVGASTGWDVSLPLLDPVRLNGGLTGYVVNETADVAIPGDAQRIRGVFEAHVPDTIMARSVATDIDGEFRLDVVPNDDYTLGWIPEAQYGLPFLVTSADALQTDTDLSVELDAGLPVYGRVTHSDDGLPTPSGTVVQPIDVRTGIAGPITEVDASGEYAIRLYPGDYELLVWHPDNLFFPEQRVALNVADADGRRLDVHYSTLSTPTLVSEVHDADGVPRANVSVRIVSTSLQGTPDGSLTVETETGPNGLFAARLVPGNYVIELIPGYEAAVGPVRFEDIDIRTDMDLGSLTVPARPTVEASVVGPTGAPVPDTLVRAQERGFYGYVYETTTDELGEFALPVADTDLVWTFEPPAAAGLATTFVTGGPEAVDQDRVDIAEGELITGTVTWQGDAVPYALVDVRDDEDRLFATASTDADGIFEIRVDVTGGR